MEALLADIEINQNLLKDAQDWEINPETNTVNLNELVATNLYVTETAAINRLAVTESIVMGSDLVISSTVNSQQLTVNSIDTLNAPLAIQASGAQPLEIMAGLIKIDTSGNVEIAGNLAVKGNIDASGLTLKAKDSQSDSGFGKLLSLENSGGQQVAGITTEGDATFASVQTDRLIVKEDPDAETSATFEGIVLATNATAGNAKIPTGSKDIILQNSNIKEIGLIFLTPTSPLANTLYIKEQVDGRAVIGFDQALTQDVNFNWWIVDIAKQASAE
jgi:hypothetical protein